ncbi:hypothetical protein PR048_020650 [Dryococelus australis]|uniref:Uncharacterized protein n=1 Tax=Dryococelus australis TaxID=614101 RepID=A0ABQ9H7B6_9NEOP|nr:hypothetical protein PR048_020650 [Dryococelus australis]
MGVPIREFSRVGGLEDCDTLRGMAHVRTLPLSGGLAKTSETSQQSYERRQEWSLRLRASVQGRERLEGGTTELDVRVTVETDYATSIAGEGPRRLAVILGEGEDFRPAHFVTPVCQYSDSAAKPEYIPPRHAGRKQNFFGTSAPENPIWRFHSHDCVEIPRCDKLLSDGALSPEHLVHVSLSPSPLFSILNSSFGRHCLHYRLPASGQLQVHYSLSRDELSVGNEALEMCCSVLGNPFFFFDEIMPRALNVLIYEKKTNFRR